jgi:hypothetical protein
MSAGSAVSGFIHLTSKSLRFLFASDNASRNIFLQQKHGMRSEKLENIDCFVLLDVLLEFLGVVEGPILSSISNDESNPGLHVVSAKHNRCYLIEFEQRIIMTPEAIVI